MFLIGLMVGVLNRDLFRYSPSCPCFRLVGISLCSAESSYTRGARVEELYKGQEELPLAPGCWEDVGTLWW